MAGFDAEFDKLLCSLPSNPVERDYLNLYGPNSRLALHWACEEIARLRAVRPGYDQLVRENADLRKGR